MFILVHSVAQYLTLNGLSLATKLKIIQDGIARQSWSDNVTLFQIVFQRFFIHGEISTFSNKIWLTYPHYNNPTLNVIICCWTLQLCMIRTQWISTFSILQTQRILQTLKILWILPIHHERLMVHKYRCYPRSIQFIQSIFWNEYGKLQQPISCLHFRFE